MFGLKTYFKNKILYPKFLLPKIKADKFPEFPVPAIRVNTFLYVLANKLRENKRHSGFGDLFTYPHSVAVTVWRRLLPYSPNNLGNWSIDGIEPNHETAVIERELIWKMIDLYKGEKKFLEGYVTSGGTEANLFSAWTGRKYLEKKGIKKENICLLKTSLTHYSLDKAADVVGVLTVTVPLNEETWGMDLKAFEKTVKEMKDKGYKGFMIALTLGYTLTGTADPYEEVCKKIRVLEKKLNVKFFVWMDAALNGLIEPFLNKDFKPFSLPEIQTFLTDFHKFGFAPIPAGILLYRKELRRLIEKPIDYLEQKDNTLLGSRSGISPVACLLLIQKLGKKGFRDLIFKRRKQMLKFKNELKSVQSLELIFRDNSLSCGIINNNKGLDMKWLINKYGLNFRKIEVIIGNKKKIIEIANAFFIK